MQVRFDEFEIDIREKKIVRIRPADDRRPSRSGRNGRSIESAGQGSGLVRRRR
jgi:hypothetical protein